MSILGVGAVVGLVLLLSGATAAGTALILFTTGSMVLAGVVLTTCGPGTLRPALAQGALPLIGFVLFLFVS